MNTTKRILAVLALATICVVVGCAGAAPGQSGRANSAQITESELAATNSDNLYDAIVKLRPDWLTTRGPKSVTDMTLASVDVVMNGTTVGNVDYLREVRLLDVSGVRFWNAGQAATRFGMGHPRGVIELIRR
jgi:hypothetical protein